MTQIRDIWIQINEVLESSLFDPNLDLGESREIPDCPKIHIGINKDRKPYLFYEHNQPKSSLPKDIAYKHIRLDFYKRIEIADQERTGLLISFVSEIDRLRIIFQETLEGIISSIARDSISDTDAIEKVKNFAELWNPKENINHDVIRGIWSEMYLIKISKEPTKMLAAWHINPSDRTDFTFQSGADIELKSFSQDRRHWFSHKQLKPRPDRELVVGSMQLESVAAGLHVENLLDDLVLLLGPSPKLDSIRSLLYAAMMRDIDSYDKMRFDAPVAMDSLHFYKSTDIPYLSVEVHPAIKEIRYEIDFQLIEPRPELLRNLVKL